MSMIVDRRGFFIGCGLAALPFKLGATTRPGTLDLIYDKPAGQWVEALPVGNGRIGGMAFGGVSQERIQLNEDTLWAGSPYDPVNPEAAANLPRVRELIDRGEFKEASDLAGAKVMAQPIRQMPYGAAGDILIDDLGAEAPLTYERGLDLREAVQRTSYRTGKGAFEREVFVSPVAQVLVVRLTAAGGGQLDLDIGYRHPGTAEYGVTGESPASAWDHREPLRSDERPADLSIEPDGAEALLVRGRNISSDGIPAGLSYAVSIRAVAVGRVSAEGETLQVRGAQAATRFVSVATS
jgi:alpha-L-fucosidase 2